MFYVKSSEKKTETIALDFDGVIHSYESGWTGYMPEDPPVEGSHDFIRGLMDDGFEVIISSARARTKAGKEGIEQWLKDNDFPKIKVIEKPEAIIYIDDRGFRFDGDFKKAKEAVKHPETWVKKKKK